MVDVTFDCCRDAGGRDPDSHSPTLRRYHQHLWSKSLPNGRNFRLDISGPKPFLVHRSELGEFHLTSDSIVHTYKSRPPIKPFIEQLADEMKAFVASRGWFIGECIVFPGKRIDGQVTINGARGMSRSIGDRFDLTLECIRRHYRGEKSPLAAVLARNRSFFDVFGSFEGYVDFFLLQDLANPVTGRVKFYLPFDDFASSPFPGDLGAYREYVRAVMAFSAGRADRIVDYLGRTGGPGERWNSGAMDR